MGGENKGDGCSLVQPSPLCDSGPGFPHGDQVNAIGHRSAVVQSDLPGQVIQFRNDALLQIAKKAQERKTGARGLRSIMESVLLETMYKIPSEKNVTKVIIDEAVIKGESEPLLMYENEAQNGNLITKDKHAGG